MTSVVPRDGFLHHDLLQGGSHWSLLMRRGTVLRLTDLQGGANLAMLLYNPVDKLERYNAPDTLKCQHTFHLTAGHCLYSDMGRIFCSIIADDTGWHDTVCGNLSDTALRQKYTVRSFQEALNEWTISGDYAFRVELGKHGLGARDITANVNFFSKVVTDQAGNLHFVDGHSQAGATVTLRFEMDTLILMHTCPHPLNPQPEYPVKPVRLEVHRAEAVKEDDLCRTHCPENRRGFENNALYHLRGGY